MLPFITLKSNVRFILKADVYDGNRMIIWDYSCCLISHTYEDAADNFNIHDQCDDNQGEQWMIEERTKKDNEDSNVTTQSEINSALKFPGH